MSELSESVGAVIDGWGAGAVGVRGLVADALADLPLHAAAVVRAPAPALGLPLLHPPTLIETSAGLIAVLNLDDAAASGLVSGQVDLGAGSLWIAAHALASGAATGFVGLPFSKARLDMHGVDVLPGGHWLLPPGSRVSAELELVHQSTPITPSPPGRDAAAATIKLPDRVDVLLEAAGAIITALHPAAVTVYGTTVNLTKAATPVRDISVGREFLVVPCISAPTDFAIGSCLSTHFVLSGKSGITSAGWALPVVSALPGSLGRAPGDDALLLEVGRGLSATYGSQPVRDVSLAKCVLVLKSGSIIASASLASREGHDRLRLWGPSSAPPVAVVPEPLRRISELDLTYVRGATVNATIVPGNESIVASCEVSANLDRPVGADGARLRLGYTDAVVTFEDTPAGRQVSLVARTPAPGERERTVALENALFDTRPSTVLTCVAKRAGERWIGDMLLVLPLGAILPTLPDPYAASFQAPRLIDTNSSGFLIAILSWALGADANLRFSLVGTPQSVLPDFTLLDVSSNADQFGVSVQGLHLPTVSVAELALAGASAEVAVYTLPGISWEPIVHDQPTDPIDWENAFSSDDGPAAELSVSTVELVRLEPIFAVRHFVERAPKATDLEGTFTLPFGLLADMRTNPETPPAQRPQFRLVRPSFADSLHGGLQLSIRAGAGKLGTPALPGTTTTGSGLHPPLFSAVYGDEVLGDQTHLDAAQFFNQQFAAGAPTAEIPVDRIDLSGYGTSMFSEWSNLDIQFVGVVRSRFDVLIGRTSYELVQLQTVVPPWSFRMTRTIIFQRSSTGLVIKQDFGWKATGDAQFELLDGHVLPGAVQRLTNIHNIRVGSGSPIEFTSPDRPDWQPGPIPPVPPNPGRKLTFVPVVFDADVVLDPAQVGARTNGAVSHLVAGTSITGWAQLNVGYAASAAEILTLMDHVGPVGATGALGCIVSVGAFDPAAVQFALNVSSVSAAATSVKTAGHATAVAVALNGTPRLSRDGSWSITRRSSTATAPTPVNSNTPIPLIRGQGGAGLQWRLLDPADALSVDAPATFYGVLQGTGTAKTLFEHPIIDNSGKSLNLDAGHLPNLADVSSLLGVGNIFPSLASVLNLNASGNPLALVGDGFKQTFEQDVNAPDRTLLQLGIVAIVLSYHAPDAGGSVRPTHVKLVLDPAASPRWSVEIDRISFNVLVDGFGPGPLLTIYGNFKASETDKPAVTGTQIIYGSALGFIKDVFSGLGPIIAAVGGEVDLDVGFAQNQLSVRDSLAVPTIPLGFGDIRDIKLELGFTATIPSTAGFHVGLGSRDKPFTWLVSPLAGTGAIVLGVDYGELDVYVEAGIGAGLGIDLAIASGSASIALQLAIAIHGSNIGLAVGLLGHAEVDVLDGLASAALTLAASLTITPQPPLPSIPKDIDLTAAVAVGIHISICWVISVDFDGSWQFTQDVPVHL